MINKNKVLIGLEQHINGSMWDRCGDCPYYSPDDSGIHCRDVLLEDLHELIGDLEPRVMTLEETRNCEVVWAEDRSTREIYPCIVKNNMNDSKLYKYGVQWRCWTSRPTDEQREATPWMT